MDSTHATRVEEITSQAPLPDTLLQSLSQRDAPRPLPALVPIVPLQPLPTPVALKPLAPAPGLALPAELEREPTPACGVAKNNVVTLPARAWWTYRRLPALQGVGLPWSPPLARPRLPMRGLRGGGGPDDI